MYPISEIQESRNYKLFSKARTECNKYVVALYELFFSKSALIQLYYSYKTVRAFLVIYSMGFWVMSISRIENC